MIFVFTDFRFQNIKMPYKTNNYQGKNTMPTSAEVLDSNDYFILLIKIIHFQFNILVLEILFRFLI